MPSTHTKEDLNKFLIGGIKLSVTLEFGPIEKYTYPATFIGLKEGVFLLLDVPIRLIEEQALRKLDNIDVVIRGISKTDLGHVIAFKTTALFVQQRPSPLLFLRIPASFVSKPVREHERYKIELDCTLKHENDVYEGTLVDFSISGCGFTSLVEPEFEVGDVVSISSPLDEYLEAEHPCSIANIKKLHKGWMIGVKFTSEVALSNELKVQLLEYSFASGNL